MRELVKKSMVIVVIICMCFTSGVSALAASKSNPSTSASVITTKATASMSIGSSTADLEIMYISSQVKKTDTSKTCHPQEFTTKSSSSSIYGSKTPQSGYIFVSVDFSFYVDNVRKALLTRYA